MGEETQDRLAESHHGAVERARADVRLGREWKARDRLSGLLAEHYDAQALELLGEVNYTMRDLPAAGAAWFATARRGDDVDEAIDAWRERHRDNFSQMWRTLPRSVRDQQGNKRVDVLRRRAEETGARDRSSRGPAGTRRRGDAESSVGVDAALVIAMILAVFLVVCTVVGFVVVLRWIVPG